MPRNILTSPWIPSCVLNHFPVDSAVCNPIIGISPSGKLLFYSRTTQVPDVPCTAIFSLSFSPSSPICSRFTLFLLPSKSVLTRSVLESFFFPTASRSFVQPRKRIRLFRSIKPYCREFYPSGFRKPVVQTRKLNGFSRNKNGSGENSVKRNKAEIISLFL